MTSSRIVHSMAERKELMVKLSDGFIALPGGLGTMDEFFEVVSLAQLGIHNKPCGILNVMGYYDDLIKFLNQGVIQGFIPQEQCNRIIISESAKSLVHQMVNYRAPSFDRWQLDLSHAKS